MSGPGVTSAWIFSFWIDVPVCDPPFGNDTHLPHSGRMHSCPNTLELTINAAKTTKPRIHFLLFTGAGCPHLRAMVQLTVFARQIHTNPSTFVLEVRIQVNAWNASINSSPGAREAMCIGPRASPSASSVR